MSLNRTYLLMIILLFLLLFLQYHLWFQQGGVIDMVRLKKQYLSAMQQNQLLKERNDKLLQEVKHFQASSGAIEANARHELGMIKKGETFYQVIDKDK